jgi:hypothetical protein
MDLLTTGYALLVILLAAIVRGFSGFGFSLIAITALSLALPPVEVIASVFLMEIAASLHLLPGLWREVAWRSVALLLAGTAAATPLGVYLLASVPVAPMKIALGALVLGVCGLLAAGFALQRAPGPLATVTAGTLAGLLNGAFGIAGPPAILLFFSSPAGAAAGRASLVAFFLGTDLIALAAQLKAGLLTLDHVWRAAMFLPALVLGVAIGARAFRQMDPERFRRRVLALIALMGIMTAAQGGAELGAWW